MSQRRTAGILLWGDPWEKTRFSQGSPHRRNRPFSGAKKNAAPGLPPANQCALLRGDPWGDPWRDLWGLLLARFGPDLGVSRRLRVDLNECSNPGAIAKSAAISQFPARSPETGQNPQGYPLGCAKCLEFRALPASAQGARRARLRSEMQRSPRDPARNQQRQQQRQQ